MVKVFENILKLFFSETSRPFNNNLTEMITTLSKKERGREKHND
jgi:hypothetical protein